MKLDLINMAALGIITYLGYKAFSEGIPSDQMAQRVTAAPTMVRKVVRRRVST